MTELLLITDVEQMVVTVTPKGDSALVLASNDGEIRHLGLRFCFSKEILTLRAPLMILKTTVYRCFRVEVPRSHKGYLCSSQVEVVIVLAGKAKTLSTVTYACCFRNAFSIKPGSYFTSFLYEVFKVKGLSANLFVSFIKMARLRIRALISRNMKFIQFLV